MKKMFATMMLLLAINISYVAADEKKDSSRSRRFIEMDIINLSNDEYERNINFPKIEATLYFNIDEIEITLYNIGDAEMYIVNSQNQVINSTTGQTDTPITVNMNVIGGQGTYYIVVMSEKWYAEGRFTL